MFIPKTFPCYSGCKFDSLLRINPFGRNESSMKNSLNFVAVLLVGITMLISAHAPRALASHLAGASKDHSESKRPLYVYPGNYRDQINQLKEKFKQDYGYELMDLDKEWVPEEIERIQAAFSQLPKNFYRLPGLKGFYRANSLQADSANVGGIPAATFPKFTTVYRKQSDTYLVVVDDQPLRIELYNDLFYESLEDFYNIMHHEMGHIYDLSHGFLSFKKEWLSLSQFQILNLPALDGTPHSDFLYTLLNKPNVPHYAPTSERHLPTYSRQNMQEDFANSVAAYIHYPYFKYSHPKRYRYLKKHVFQDKEYVSNREKSEYMQLVLLDFNKALEDKDWDRVINIVKENSRSLRQDVETKMVKGLKRAIETKVSEAAVVKLAVASCYLYHPEGMKLRKSLLISGRIQLGKVLKNERCFRLGRRAFEGGSAHWPMSDVFFYRKEGRDYIQFLDPVVLTAFARGFETEYVWRLSLSGNNSRTLAQGKAGPFGKVNGSVVIDLKATAKGKYRLLEGQPLILELGAQRKHPQASSGLNSNPTQIRFRVQPWFEYMGPEQPTIRVQYPAGWLGGVKP